MNKEYLNAIRHKLDSDRRLLELDLENLLSNTTGVGEHVYIHNDVYELIKKIDELRGQIETINDFLTRKGLV